MAGQSVAATSEQPTQPAGTCDQPLRRGAVDRCSRPDRSTYPGERVTNPFIAGQWIAANQSRRVRPQALRVTNPFIAGQWIAVKHTKEQHGNGKDGDQPLHRGAVDRCLLVSAHRILAYRDQPLHRGAVDRWARPTARRCWPTRDQPLHRGAVDRWPAPARRRSPASSVTNPFIAGQWIAECSTTLADYFV